MPHINSRYIRKGGIEGEFSIKDFVVFTGDGKLKHVSVYWEATVALALILDEAHAHAIAAADEPLDESDPEAAFVQIENRKILQVSDTCLIKANIFCLLVGFVEYAMLEVYSLVFGGPPLERRPDLKKHILPPLQARGVVSDTPAAYEKYVSNNRDAVRNAFLHGRWGQLKATTAPIELYDVFAGIVSYLGAVELNLRKQGFNP